MSAPDIQYFGSDGTWTKPPGAVRADVVIQGAGGGGAITVRSIPAGNLPDEITVTIGKGGRPGGRDGYALIVTHLEPVTAREPFMARHIEGQYGGTFTTSSRDNGGQE